MCRTWVYFLLGGGLLLKYNMHSLDQELFERTFFLFHLKSSSLIYSITNSYIDFNSGPWMLHSNKVPVDSLLAKMVLRFLLGLVLMYSAWKESFL